MGILKTCVLFLRAMRIPKSHLVVENLALRQQLAVLRQSVKRPKLRPRDRVFWVWLSRLWPNWRSTLILVQPETVIRWHRQGFKLYWRWKSRAGKPGRPRIKREIRDLIRRMSRENPTWGAPRILSELLLLGHDVAEATVAKYMVCTRKPPSQTWRTFLDNHVGDIAACDFFTIPDRHFPCPLRLHRAPSRSATPCPFQRYRTPLRPMDCPTDRQRLPGRGSTLFSHSRSRRHLR
jgi:putative transposase